MHVALIGAELEENLAVRYLRGALERDGHTVTQIVFNAAGEVEAAAARLAASGAALAGFSLVFTYRAREFARLATRCRALGFRGHIVAGGHFAAFFAERLLAEIAAFDSVGCGEGEPIICALARNLGNLRAVDGLIWRSEGGIVRNRAAAPLADLDLLAVPPRKQPFDEYLGIPITNLLSSRGCTHSCSFCSIAAWHRLCGGGRHRLRAPARVADEMAELYRQGVRIFNFHDDNFLLPDRAETFARLESLEQALRRRGVGRIAFAIKARPDEIDAELVARLRALGLFRVFLGIEAGTAASLARLGRGQTLGDNERALAILAAADVHTCFNLLLLNPDSSLEDLAANVAFLHDHPRNPMNFCRTEVYAGTPLAQRLRRAGRLLGDLWGYDYVIADPRAQAAFAIIYRAFEPRNYHEDGLHHLTMQVDFEHQLLAHFFGTEPRLRRRVKQFIVTVNHDSCAWLRAIVAALRDGVPGPAERARLVARLTSAIAAANASLGQVGHALVDDIRDLGRRRTRQRAWARGAAAAGLAASLTLLPAACKDGTHPTETIPAPPIEPADAGTTHPTEMVAPPPASASAVAPAASGASAPTGTSDAGATGPPAVGTTHPREAAPRPTTHMHERVPPRPRTPHHPTEMVPFAPQLKTPEK